MDMAAILVRALRMEEQSAILPTYLDSAQIPAWAKNDIAVASDRGLAGGFPDNTFRPRNLATRAEATVMINRFMEQFGTQYDYYGILQIVDADAGKIHLDINGQKFEIPVLAKAKAYLGNQPGQLAVIAKDLPRPALINLDAEGMATFVRVLDEPLQQSIKLQWYSSTTGPSSTVASNTRRIETATTASGGEVITFLGKSLEITKEEAGAIDIYWRVQESTDGKTWTTIDPEKINIDTTVANERTLKFYGIDVKIDGTQANLLATSPTFETFTIRPYANAAANMDVAVSDPNKVAAASGDLDTKFTITTGVNDTIIVNGNPVTLSNGSYNRFELANELQTRLNALLGAGAVTVAFDAQINKFRVTNNTVAGSVTISWTSQSTTAEDLFGFTSNADSVIPQSGYAESINEIKGGSIVIGSSNNTIRFSEDGGNSYNDVTIPSGIYTRDELAAVLKKALEDANTTSDTYTISYSTATKKYTIQNDAGNINSIILDWTNTTTTVENIFGFNSNSIISVGGSDLSDFEVYPILPGDNSNAKLIASFAGSGFIKGSTPIDYYRAIVTDVSVEANSAKISQKFHNTMVEELERKRQEASGVNLDEEAANLIKYQKSFEAAAKMISVADSLLDALINMAGR